VSPVTGSGTAGGFSGTVRAVQGATREGGWKLIRLSSVPMVFLAQLICRQVATEGTEVAWATAGKSGRLEEHSIGHGQFSGVNICLRRVGKQRVCNILMDGIPWIELLGS